MTSQPVSPLPPARRPRLWSLPEPPSGAVLAAIRRGVGHEAGTVPAMWRYYATLGQSTTRPAAFAAEHLALTLFAVHQQSKRESMHRHSIGLGKAVLQLKRSPSASAEAVDRRFHAAATAATLGALGVHLRGLVSQLRGLNQPLDYDRLERDLRHWDDPAQQQRVRLDWGRQYYSSADHDPTTASTDPTPTTPGSLA